ncbi:chemotaxis protein CheW [Lignipirellula cremea]|uniref:Chemotaxis protein CheW n=1 Tax=Lignipirellula cremea TaxID=2528010 RepID=A0A518DUA4_9BACT|nr:chemotaxis protein CheW [Lignipirellula cremea]QDU95422.1 Chemotaxis protein CheW [Lignipirellula cremea]
MSTATFETPSRELKRDSNAEGTLQLVSFQLAEEEYGIEINKVREIILVGEITQVPQTPAYVKGLINLRSTVIPVVDLRLRFQLSEASVTDDTRIVVINIGGKTIGIIVDAVNEVLRVSKNQIAPPPPTVAGLGHDYLVGLVKLKERLLILLDIEKILVESVGPDPESLSALI